MLVKESDARNMFVEMGFQTSKDWNRERLETKLENIPKLLANGANEPKGNNLSLMKKICEAIKEGDDVKLEEDVEEDLLDEEEEKDEELEDENQQEVEEDLDSEEEKEDKKLGKRGRKPTGKKELKITIPPEVAFRTGILEEGKPKLVKVSQDLATRFKNMERFPRDRDLTSSRMNYLVGEILSGSFHGTTWVAAKIVKSEKEYRINGNHTSNVFCQLFEQGVDLDELNIYILVKEYLCDTMEDAAALYSTFDPRQSSRTKGNIVQSYAGSSELLQPINNKIISMATTGVAMHKWDSDYKKHDVKEQSKLMLHNPDFVAWLDKILGKKKDNEHVWRVPVVAGMARTYFKDKKACTEFWTMIRDDCNLEKDSPVRTLYRFLTTSSLGAKSGTSDKKTVSDREMFMKCVQAWNGWREGKKVKLIYAPKADVPDAV